jgi:hypothetical protein
MASKVIRADLHLNDDRRKHLMFRDLRATGFTWAAARGDDPLRIKQRARHLGFATDRDLHPAGGEHGARLCPPVPSATARTGLGSSGSVSVFRIRKTPKAPRISSGTRDSNPYDSRHETSPKPARSTEKQAPTPSGGVANAATIADGSQRSQLEPSDADLERAIVAAMLDGRGAVAELLAERLMRTSAHACGCGPPRTSRVPAARPDARSLWQWLRRVAAALGATIPKEWP